jgi:DNA-binding NarL/FixJ family response regulator
MKHFDPAQCKQVGIVEDHEDMQIIYKRMFRKIKETEIVLQVATAEEALEKIPNAALDLIIIDISLPGMDGLTLCREIRIKYPNLKILIATGHDQDAYESASKEAGADGFITKGDGAKMVAETCRLLGLGEKAARGDSPG